ncbi:MAG TPA: FtsX-like permease family protein, partial [Gemmatimonadaceae bacterium]|nr:FtsX-like permease family protein [Gemmatimonadaceae bacterium]
MLASGMRVSFRSLLLSQGFQIRLAPRGTLPFDTDATIPGAAAIIAKLMARGDVRSVSPVLGAQLHVERGGASVSAAALGTLAAVQGDYKVLGGRAPASGDEAVANDALLGAVGARLGDTLRVAAGFDPQLRGFTGQRTLRIVGRAHFIYLAAGERALALPLASLQAMEGATQHDRVSLIMVRLRDGANVESARATIDRDIPAVSAISTATAIEQVEQRLSYFRQLAFILGTVSLAVGFLLVTTLVTVSVNERLGEIAVLRAIGVRRIRVVEQILIEGTAIMLIGAVLGLGLGLLTARYLNSILASFPGLPEAIDFFLFEPRDAWVALGLLAVCGILAGVYPAWRGASLPIAGTLREEAVA